MNSFKLEEENSIKKGKDKYICKDCKSIIKNNPSNISRHNKTKKHIKSISEIVNVGKKEDINEEIEDFIENLNEIVITDKKSKGEKEEEKEEENIFLTKIDLGLCCINTVLRKKNPSVFPNRTCRLSTVENEGVEYAKKLALQNIKDVLEILDWNYKNNIRSYRLSSDMFPHINNKRIGVHHEPYGNRYDLNFAKEYLKKIGEKALEYNIRLSFHPGQYNQIGTPTQSVFDNTVIDLSVHAYILDIIEEGLYLGKNRGILCIHGGGVYKNKQDTINRWINRFKLLPENVRSRICLENCERCYSTEDCLKICNAVNIPLIYDIHHYNCYNILHPEEKQEEAKYLMPKVLNTWKRRNLKPYFHISEQGSGRIGHHSDYIEEIPDYILNIGESITLDVEAKAKEQAILHLLKIYGDKITR